MIVIRPPAIVLLVGFITFQTSCASSVPGPPLVSHPLSAYREVPFPPPAALSEAVPPSPISSAVWLDGSWKWQRQSYVWRHGGWLLVPDGVRFAPWNLYYTRDGLIMFAPGIWYGALGARIRPPAVRTNAYTPPNETTPEFQPAR
jgi:hypothetical protein